ncbi:hypothetical protein [Streptomyces cacaoi]|uniref:hypothetical protein n=1 Tax=Streptomyces cacaoi TaxID=1898 RepID=UPI002635CA53|nr:hypothetical protein [Streptomyces cacaoi]
MTAENNGAGNVPGDASRSQAQEGEDDPFAYLYRQEGGAQSSAAGAAPQQPGVPRRSYNQVRAVGERQYGYGYPQQQQQQQPAPPAGQPSPHYAAPETMPGGRAAARRQQAGGPAGGGRGGRNRTGLLVGAIAVVAAVVAGIGAAIVFNKDDSESTPQAGSSEDAGKPQENDTDDRPAGDEKDDKKDKPAQMPKEDAASLTLAGGAAPAKDVPNAESRGGTYVAGFNKPGASATWELKDVPPGQYSLYLRYGVPGKDADATLTVNGEKQNRPLRMKNWSGAKEGDWAKGWSKTWANVTLKKGRNAIKISCEDGNSCEANLDQVWLKKGWGG